MTRELRISILLNFSVQWSRSMFKESIYNVLSTNGKENWHFILTSSKRDAMLVVVVP